MPVAQPEAASVPSGTAHSMTLCPQPDSECQWVSPPADGGDWMYSAARGCAAQPCEAASLVRLYGGDTGCTVLPEQRLQRQ